VADALGQPRENIATFKRLAMTSIAKVARGRDGFGTLLDDTYGREALFEAEKMGLWIGRPLEEPGSRPLRFEHTQDVGSRLVEWPVNHCVKCLAFYHPDDPVDLKAQQLEKYLQLYQACRKVGRELLIEIIAGKNGPLKQDTVARVMTEIYHLGIKPDWWKLEPQTDAAAWDEMGQVIDRYDRHCRGILLLGLAADPDELARGFAAVARTPHVKGFAVGRTIFAEAAQEWLRGTISDNAAINQMADRFGHLVDLWNNAKN
jgi:5-dehydro-2-deoxygluconokinase